MDCLRHFIAVLIDEHQWGRLCSFPFSGMENEVWINGVLMCHYHGNEQVEEIIEARARSLDITAAHPCYELLYCYHVSRSNYRKGT